MNNITFYLWLADFANTIDTVLLVLGGIFLVTTIFYVLINWPPTTDDKEKNKREIIKITISVFLTILFIGGSAVIPEKETIYTCIGLELSTFPEDKITDKELYEKVFNRIVKNIE